MVRVARWTPPLLAVCVLAGTAVVCAAASAPAARQAPRITITPAASLADEPVRIRVSGLAPREHVTVAVRSKDAKGITWVSSTAFRADARGRLDLARSAASGGFYRGVWGMGAIATMQPTTTPAANAYFWGNVQRFTVGVRAKGRTLASAVFRRRFSARAIHPRATTVRAEGFFGDLWTPAISGTRPAVLVLGGSEGGVATYLLAASLAARGFPALALAYFKEPGLPQTLSNIPLEYFAKALRWLREQPHVDPKRVVALGVSRGSEAALLLGVHYPELVRGVVAAVPANVAVCSFPGCTGPAWTFDGKPVPYTRQFDEPYPTDDPDAVIPVERIQGPIFLDCAGMDFVWTSCAYATAIVQRLDAHGFRHPHVLHRYPKAGHHVGVLIPYEPIAVDNPRADEEAREHQWRLLLAFLNGM
jgi:dienelactone hydrolase